MHNVPVFSAPSYGVVDCTFLSMSVTLYVIISMQQFLLFSQECSTALKLTIVDVEFIVSLFSDHSYLLAVLIT